MRMLIMAASMLVIVLMLFQTNSRASVAFREISQENQEKVSPDLLLPDLKATPPLELFIESTAGRKILHFSSTFINQGEGALEINGVSDTKTQKTKAYQRILHKDGTKEERELGEFVFHPGHDHWHTEKYILFQLFSLKEDNQPDKLLVSTEKMSFCLWDENPFDLDIENASSQQVYIGCNNDVQGISVGWSDTYLADVPGQELDITSIPDGNYLVKTIVNPERKILESDYSNNKATLFIEISGDTIKSLQED